MIYGRDRERAQLRELLDDAIAGHGSLVLISGEAGIGKTTLVDDLIHEAEQRNCLVLTGGCYDLTTTPPYWPWAEVIRGYDPPDGGTPIPIWFANPEAMEQMGSQAQLFEEARRFFAEVAINQPLVIVLEDLHWSDNASLDALRFLSRQISNEPWLIVATYRDDEITRRHQLFQLLPALVRESGAARVHVKRLEDADIRELVAGEHPLDEEDLDRLTAHIARLAEGNPFYAVELLQALNDEGIIRSENGAATVGPLVGVTVPPLIQQVIERRLSRFDDAQRKHLEAAAVIGHNVPLDIWLAVTDLDATELADLAMAAVSARILEQTLDGDGFRFSHALIRESLYNGSAVIVRRSDHRTVAESLATMASSDPATVAFHFRKANDQRAVDWLVEAATAAHRAWALIEAAEFLDLAIEILEPDRAQQEKRAWLLSRAANLRRFQDARHGLAYVEEAHRIAKESHNRALEAISLWQAGVLRSFLGQNGLSEIERGFAILETLADEELVLISDFGFDDPALAEGRESLALFLAAFGRYDDAESQYSPIPPENRMNDASFSEGYVSVAFGRARQAQDAFRRARSRAKLGRRFYLSGGASTNELRTVHLFYRTEYLNERSRLVQEAREDFARAGDVAHDVDPEFGALPIWLLEGNWDAAEDVGRRISGTVYLNVVMRDTIATIARNKGQNEQARELIDVTLPEGHEAIPGTFVVYPGLALQRLAAQLCLDENDLGTAGQWLDAHERALHSSGRIQGRSELEVLWAHLYRQAGDLDKARQHADCAYQHASDPRQPLALIAADRFLGQLDVDEGRHADATEHLDASLVLAERCEAPFEQALTLVVMAERAAKLGEVDEARRLIKRVREICEPLGAKPTLERIAAIEGLLPRTRRGTEDHPFGLTGREIEVLRLVARGRTDAEAAEELFISPRTVGQHLRNAYNKLGVNNRAEATRLAVEHGLT